MIFRRSILLMNEKLIFTDNFIRIYFIENYSLSKLKSTLRNLLRELQIGTRVQDNLVANESSFLLLSNNGMESEKKKSKSTVPLSYVYNFSPYFPLSCDRRSFFGARPIQIGNSIMAKKKKVTAKKAKKPVQKPSRRSLRLQKIAPPCNGLFCSDPGCNHGKKGNKVNKGSKTCARLKQIQKPAIAKKRPVKRQTNKPVKCPKKKNRRRMVLSNYNRFVSHVSKRCRDAGIKQTDQFNYVKQASICWKDLTLQQKELFKRGITDETQAVKVGTAPGSPPAPSPAPENPPPAPAPQPAAPQVPPNPGTRQWPGTSSPYFFNGTFPF